MQDYKFPPEVLERFALYLDQNSLTKCIRVSRLWFDCFLPALYRRINVRHFDYYITQTEGGYPSRSDGITRTTETVGFGGQFIYKHHRFIKEVNVMSAFALKYLIGPECVNLEKIAVYRTYSAFSRRKYSPEEAEVLEKWREKYKSEGDGALVLQLWKPLFTQNKGLRKIKLGAYPGEDKAMAKALGALPQLEELYIRNVRSWSTTEALLDFCPKVGNITIEMFSNRFSNPHQTFRSRENYTDITDEPKTQIKSLDLFTIGRRNRSPWIIPVLWRCPLLECFVFPSYGNEHSFPKVARALVMHNPKLRDLKVSIGGLFQGPESKNALKELLEGCPNLSTISLVDHPNIFELDHHLEDPKLRQRLEHFDYSANSEKQIKPVSEMGFGVLSVCPNLRSFKARLVMMEVEGFLEMDIACFKTLETLEVKLDYRSLSSESESEDAADESAHSIDQARMKVEEEKMDNLYRQELQTKILDKLVKFEALTRLKIGRSEKEFSCVLPSPQHKVFYLAIGQDELLLFSKMPRLKSLNVDGVSYSSKLGRMRCFSS
ncbi:hypothetical protein FBU30_006205 [Linnemannia zychae]|nr:hypothetical protein FBU30_006205 [Linnemannia zychae]